DARAIVRATLSALEPAAQTKGLRFAVDLPEQEVPMHADHERVQQVLRNLVGNAIKFSDAGAIVVRLERVDREVKFMVRDQGRGIAPHELGHIFESHWRSPRSVEEGYGLGLFIARRIVEAHGGRISAESRVGAGSCFTFVLPSLT